MPDKIIPQPPTPSGDDKLALSEFEAIGRGRNLEKEEAESNFDRNKLTKSILAWVIRGLVVIAGIALASGLFVWVYHLLAPDCYRWLSDERISEIQDLVTSALLGMVASEYARRLFH
jgi:hypothetical protein